MTENFTKYPPSAGHQVVKFAYSQINILPDFSIFFQFQVNHRVTYLAVTWPASSRLNVRVVIGRWVEALASTGGRIRRNGGPRRWRHWRPIGWTSTVIDDADGPVLSKRPKSAADGPCGSAGFLLVTHTRFVAGRLLTDWRNHPETIPAAVGSRNLNCKSDLEQSASKRLHKFVLPGPLLTLCKWAPLSNKKMIT